MNTETEFTIVPYASVDYKKSMILREEILRRPLGLSFHPEEIEAEKDYIHIAAYLGEKMCAALVLVPEGDELKMQRVAVKSAFQNKGLGSALLRFCEKYAQKHFYKSIYCHAREAAIEFYSKNRYFLEGNPFDEDGMAVHKMRKNLLEDYQPSN